MLQRVFLFLIATSTITAVRAEQPSQVISSPAPSPATGVTNQSAPSTQAGHGNLTFTNRTGTVYTMDQLAVQLQNLRASVEQTLPMLSAFTETFSNATPSGVHSIGGAISSILSEALHRNSGQTQNVAGTSGQPPTRTNSLMAVLQGLLNTNTNATGSSTLNPNTAQDLVTLQQDLQPVTSILQNLNITTNSLNQTTSPSTTTSGNPRPPNGGLTPTGR